MSRKDLLLLCCVSVWMVWKVKIVDGLGDKSSCNHASPHRQTLRDLIPATEVYRSSVQHIQNDQCRKDAGHLLDALEKMDMWGLKMFDSTGKMSSGILNGNVNQMGDFDQCLSIDTKQDVDTDIDVVGKYCLAFVDYKLNKHSHLDQLLHSYSAFASNFTDPGHRVARLTTLSWGFCLPRTCSAHDLQQFIEDTWGNNDDITMNVRVEEGMCYVKEEQRYSTPKIFTLILFAVLSAMTLLGSFVSDEDNNNVTRTTDNKLIQLLRAFSLRNNWRRMMDTSTPADDIKCLHGIRGLNALALIIFHKSAAVMFYPFVNRTSMNYSLGLAWSVIGRTAIIYTDAFILISGLLTSYIFIKDLDRKGKVNIKDKYWTRFFRIIPNLVAVILFCTYILVDMGSGPQWNLVVKQYSDLCKSNMWRNFFFIHNYFGFENMCLTHTHQLGIDMQLFIISPFVIWLLWRHLKAGLVIVTSLSLISTLLRYKAAIDHQLSPVIYYGVTVTQMFDTANFSYILPSHRATVYLMGILMGFALRRIKPITLNKFQVTLLYVLAVSMGLYAMCGPYQMARRGYVYSAIEAANWNAFSPILWCSMICIGIVLCINGYGGWLDDLLSWRGFVIFTRIAYGVYLTQFPVFFYNVGTQRSTDFYTPFMLFNVAEVGVILLASVTLTLLVDLPFQQIKKITWRDAVEKPIRCKERSQLNEGNRADNNEVHHVHNKLDNVTKRLIHAGAQTG